MSFSRDNFEGKEKIKSDEGRERNAYLCLIYNLLGPKKSKSAIFAEEIS